MITINVQQNNEDEMSKIEATFCLTDVTITEAMDVFIKALQLETYTDASIINGLKKAAQKMMGKDNEIS